MRRERMVGEEGERKKGIVEKVIKNDLDAILGGNGKKLVESADELGRYLCRDGEGTKKLTTSQIRSVFAHVQRMRVFDRNELNLLRPKLAYAAGRHRGTKVKDLQEVIDAAIQKVDDGTKFNNFKQFFEAILAYHKYWGGE